MTGGSRFLAFTYNITLSFANVFTIFGDYIEKSPFSVKKSSLFCLKKFGRLPQKSEWQNQWLTGQGEVRTDKNLSKQSSTWSHLESMLIHVPSSQVNWLEWEQEVNFRGGVTPPLLAKIVQLCFPRTYELLLAFDNAVKLVAASDIIQLFSISLNSIWLPLLLTKNMLEGSDGDWRGVKYTPCILSEPTPLRFEDNGRPSNLKTKGSFWLRQVQEKVSFKLQ